MSLHRTRALYLVNPPRLRGQLNKITQCTQCQAAPKAPNVLRCPSPAPKPLGFSPPKIITIGKKTPMGSENSLEGAARKSHLLIYPFLDFRTHLAGLLGRSLPTQPRLISN